MWLLFINRTIKLSYSLDIVTVLWRRTKVFTKAEGCLKSSFFSSSYQETKMKSKTKSCFAFFGALNLTDYLIDRVFVRNMCTYFWPQFQNPEFKDIVQSNLGLPRSFSLSFRHSNSKLTTTYYGTQLKQNGWHSSSNWKSGMCFSSRCHFRTIIIWH